MQSKIIFLMLFMISFNMMHDTVIHILDDNAKLSLSEYIQNMKQTSDVQDMQNIHDMFHFIALIPVMHISLKPLKARNIFSAYVLQYTLISLNKHTKPPIV